MAEESLQSNFLSRNDALEFQRKGAKTLGRRPEWEMAAPVLDSLNGAPPLALADTSISLRLRAFAPLR
jgi:hypothetical protein